MNAKPRYPFRVYHHTRFAHAYRDALMDLLGARTRNARGQPTRDLGLSLIQWDADQDKTACFSNPERSTDLRYLTAELYWYYTCRDDAAWIGRFAKLWNEIRNPDGTVNSAYGNRLFRPHPTTYGHGRRSEVEWAVDQILQDPDTRRASMVIHRPMDHWDGNRDVPCTMYVQAWQEEGALNLRAHMRSTDAWFGLPFDAPFFESLQRLIGFHLEQRGAPRYAMGSCGILTDSLHLYERNAERVDRMLNHAIEPLKVPVMDCAPFDHNEDPALLHGAWSDWVIKGVADATAAQARLAMP